MKISGLLCAAAVLLTSCGCERLGNPPLRRGSTPPTEWTNGVDRVQTRLSAANMELAPQLLDGLDADAIHESEGPRAGQVVALTEVRLQFGRRRVPLLLRLVTELTYLDGTVVRKTWQGPASAPVLRAVFALDEVPRQAVTALLN